MILSRGTNILPTASPETLRIAEGLKLDYGHVKEATKDADNNIRLEVVFFSREGQDRYEATGKLPEKKGENCEVDNQN